MARLGLVLPWWDTGNIIPGFCPPLEGGSFKVLPSSLNPHPVSQNCIKS